MKNLPQEQKLTCKGNVPAKLATVKVEASTLNHYTLDITKDDVDVSSLAEEMATKVIEAVVEAGFGDTLATKVIEAVVEAGFGDTFDAVNGEGYMEQWHAEIVRSVEAIAIGTAVQGRAFKQTVCANSEHGCMAHFASDGKATKKVAKDNPFAKAE
jgi:Glu-tRNA(Gln) amidotransferase subunit E-like FAD-binding protein